MCGELTNGCSSACGIHCYLQISLTSSQYVIVTNLEYEVTTPTNQLANGDCCLSSETPPSCTSCPNLRLRLCAREDRHDTDDLMNCSIGSLGLGVGALVGATVSFSSAENYTVCYMLHSV